VGTHGADPDHYTFKKKKKGKSRSELTMFLQTKFTAILAFQEKRRKSERQTMSGPSLHVEGKKRRGKGKWRKRPGGERKADYRADQWR